MLFRSPNPTFSDQARHTHVHALVHVRGTDGRQLRTTRDTVRERGELAALSWALLAQAREAKGEERARLLRLAEAAARHGEALPEARTWRQALAAIAEEMRAKGRAPDAASLAAELGPRRGAE